MATGKATKQARQNDHQLEILAYPACMTCGTPYCLRRAFGFPTGKPAWAWFRDCRHKAADAKIVTPESPEHA